jgi:hypothetical protein
VYHLFCLAKYDPSLRSSGTIEISSKFISSIGHYNSVAGNLNEYARDIPWLVQLGIKEVDDILSNRNQTFEVPVCVLCALLTNDESAPLNFDYSGTWYSVAAVFYGEPPTRIEPRVRLLVVP